MNPNQVSGTDDDRKKERRKRKSQCEKERRERSKVDVEAMKKRIGMLDEENFYLRQTIFFKDSILEMLQKDNFLLKTKLEIVKKDCFRSVYRSNAGFDKISDNENNGIGGKLLQTCVEQQLDASCTSVFHHMFFQPTPTNSAATREYDSSPSQKLDFSV
jgi:hypothetical protein